MKTDIDPKELRRRLDAGESLRIVDVRSSLEYGIGHVPGAENFPLHTLKGEIPGITADEPVVLVCQSGLRSSMACQNVLANHKAVFNLVGGTSAWQAAGFEVVRRPKSRISLVRQAHLVAGVMIAAAFALSATVSPNWIYLAGLPMFGLLLDALTGLCPVTLLLRKMPWNAGLDTSGSC